MGGFDADESVGDRFKCIQRASLEEHMFMSENGCSVDVWNCVYESKLLFYY